MPTAERALMWFRRDLRLADNPALDAAIAAGADGVLGVFILDDRLLRTAGSTRTRFLIESINELKAEYEARGGEFVVAKGDPRTELDRLVSKYEATSVHAAADFTPVARRRDDGLELSVTGSPYAVAPGRIHKDDGTPYKVFTPYYKRWLDHGWRTPVAAPDTIPSAAAAIKSAALPKPPSAPGPPGGESAAIARWKEFLDDDLADYNSNRNRPDLDSTSRISPYLHFGCIHPRTLLADLGNRHGAGATSYRRELTWRDFYADVLWHNPESAHHYLDPRFADMEYASGKSAADRLQRWKDGKTGYPIVDAGMRQLLAEGWVHNRVRMIVASFLVKDLHLEWTAGAQHFMDHLVDADVASNQHGWQWVAGCGTDAAPYFRVFNPMLQGRKFDPQGDYVRRYVPELRSLEGAQAHEPHELGLDYPAPIVDHFVEREVALERYKELPAR
ncbi:MAG: deoxyribodipyrimidine photo-lyase [Antricoccus sp.]